jgi:hypothetical protein
MAKEAEHGFGVSVGIKAGRDAGRRSREEEGVMAHRAGTKR